MVAKRIQYAPERTFSGQGLYNVKVTIVIQALSYYNRNLRHGEIRHRASVVQDRLIYKKVYAIGGGAASLATLGTADNTL